MKKLICSLIAAVGLANFSNIANATLLINEPFTYSDGQLTNVSSMLWTNHSGANVGPVTVTSGKITLQGDGSHTEDVMRSLGLPYNTNLYVSFKINFSTLPVTAGTYFSHFSQNAATFRCRIQAQTTGAAAGKYRLALANGSTFTALTTDLDLATEYKVVARFTGTTNATMWINPTSESSIVSRVDATDLVTGAYTNFFFAFRQAANEGVVTIDDLLIGTLFSDVQTVGGPPSISGLSATSIAANTNTGPLAFVVSDVETPAASLTVAATSSNPTLVPNNPANLTFGGSGGSRTLTVTPAVSQQGTATIETVVTDGSGFKATNSFLLTVGSPSISSIANQIALTNTVKSVSLTVNDTETAPGSLTVTATSSDQTVLPDANIGIVNPGSTSRTLLLTNAAPGVATVTVTVSDGTFSIPTTFILTAYADNGILLADDFGYADGSVVANSAGNVPYPWVNNTGSNGQLQVTSGKLIMVNTNSEDVYRWFTNTAITSTSGQLIHTRFVANFSALPTANGVGEYFSHIYAFSGAYRARLIATTNGAAAGKYRISIANGGFVTATFPQDLTLGDSHVIISRYNTGTAESTLWIDPTSEASTSVSATDATTTTTIYGISFRQQTGTGSMSIDDLLVGSTFNEVLLVLASSNANLSALTLSSGTLSPTFASNTVSYTASVANSISNITVTPTVADATATIQARVNGGGYASVTSGSPSGALALNVGANTVDVKVTAQDTTTIKTYTVTVTRAAPPVSEPIIIVSSGSNLIMSWTQAALNLASATNVVGPYLPVPGATSPYTNSTSIGTMFFRLQYP
jgi:trimeric autotransporter adhesin